MAGTAIGLDNIWRFPYMLGVFSGAGFLLDYFGCVLALGVPALMCEWTLGRITRRGPVRAFENCGLPGGRFWGLLFGVAILMAASYYSRGDRLGGAVCRGLRLPGRIDAGARL